MFPNGSGFSAPEDDQFWKRSLELGVKLSPHFGFGLMSPPLSNVGLGTEGDPFAATLTQRASSMPPIYTVSQLICAGVFDRFPEIEFVDPREPGAVERVLQLFGWAEDPPGPEAGA